MPHTNTEFRDAYQREYNRRRRTGEDTSGTADFVREQLGRESPGSGSPTEPPVVDPASIGRDSGSGRDSDLRASGSSSWLRNLFRGDGKQPKPASKSTTQKVDLSGLEKQLMALHLFIALRWEIPEYALDPVEAKQLEEAFAGVFRHYPITASQKAWDWGNLLFVLATVEGSRGLLLWQKVRAPGIGHNRPPGPIRDSPAAANGAAPAPPTTGRPGIVTPGQMDPTAMLNSQVGNA
jgi:hypothetical protein